MNNLEKNKSTIGKISFGVKNFFFSFIFVFLLIFTLAFNGVALATTVSSSPTTISDLIELLITIGVIEPDKAVAARAVAVQLSATTVTTSLAVSTSTSYLQVLSPNGGESFDIDLDVSRSFTWGSTGLSQVNLALVSSNSKTQLCNLNQLPISSLNGTHTYNILLKTAKCYNLITGTSTPVKDGSYKLRVYYTDPSGITIKDESNATFKITPKLIPSLKVTYPNGGENLIRNHEYDVKYKLTNVNSVTNNLIYLYLLDSNGNSVYNSHKAKRSDSTYSLDLPSSLSAGSYKIKLITTTSDDRVEIEDISDNFFWISTGL